MKIGRWRNGRGGGGGDGTEQEVVILRAKFWTYNF